MPALAGGLLAAVGLALALAVSADRAAGASSSVTVTATITSAISLTNGCTGTSSYNLGAVLPGASATTATGAGVCSFTFQSNNDSAMARMYQADGEGTALGTGSLSLANQAEEPLLTDVDAWNGSYVYASGSVGKVYRTANGGGAWSDISSGFSTSSMRGIAVASQAIVYVVGSSGRIEKSTDADAGSPTWAVQTSNTTQSLRGVAASATDPNDAVAVGSQGTIRYTTNGGSTWSTPASVPGALGTNAVYAVTWASATAVYASAGGGVVLRSLDGGANWADISIAGSTWRAISATDVDTVFVYGSSGNIRKATSASTAPSWSTLTSGVTEDLRGASSVLGSATSFAVGVNGVVIKTSNGGALWTPVTSGTGNNLTSIDAFDVSTVFAAGSGNLVTRTTDGGATPMTVVKAGMGDVEDIVAVSSIVAFVAGTGGLVRRTADGTNWTTQTSATTVDLFGIDAADALTAYAAGAAGTIRKTVDGGATAWSVVVSGTGTTLRAIAAPTASQVWVVGDSGLIRKSGDGGANWAAQASGTAEHLRDIDMVDANVGWAVGDNGVIRKTVDGGANWTVQASCAAGVRVNSVSAVDATTAFVAAESAICRTVNGGTNWTSVTSPYSSMQFSISAASATVVYLAHDSEPFRSEDGGTTWTGLGGTLPMTMAVGRIDANRVFVTGESGLIRKSGLGTVVDDFAPGTADWVAGARAFGACLQAVSAQTVVNAPTWQLDAAGIPGQCETANTDPWNNIPAAAEKVASTANPGDTGRIDLVWGFRAASNQTPGTYYASVVIEALAPNV